MPRLRLASLLRCGLFTGLVSGALVAAAPRDAGAQPAPTPEQIEQAKTAFGAGKKAFDAGDFQVAVEKFKESYRLSRNPLLLFNIALTFERLGTTDMALFYYRKFLSDAPADAVQRADAEKSVVALEKAAAPAPDADDPFGDGGATGGGDDTADEPPPKPVKKPKRTAAYTIDDFEHQVVDEAPPGRPLDLTAFVPEDSGWSVVLHVRAAGDDRFVAIPMRPRYNELVGRVPAAKMTGNAIQYYLELKDAGGETLTRVGKPTSPNVVYIDANARPRFYPDLEDTVTGGGGGGGSAGAGDFDDPLTGRGGGAGGSRWGNRRRSGGTGGFTDVGSDSFTYMKWGSTATGIASLTLSMTFYLMGSNMASTIEGEAAFSNDPDECGSPPCATYDQYLKDVESRGKTYATLTTATLVIGLAASGVATYYWYKDIKARKRAERAAGAGAPPPATARRPVRGIESIIATPVAGDDFIGGAAALRF